MAVSFRRGLLLPKLSFHSLTNSAAAERIFSLLELKVKLFFGDERTEALADQIQATLKLRSNDRSVGHASCL